MTVSYPPVRYRDAEVPQTEINSQRDLCQVVIDGGVNLWPDNDRRSVPRGKWTVAAKLNLILHNCDMNVNTQPRFPTITAASSRG